MHDDRTVLSPASAKRFATSRIGPKRSSPSPTKRSIWRTSHASNGPSTTTSPRHCPRTTMARCSRPRCAYWTSGSRLAVDFHANLTCWRPILQLDDGNFRWQKPGASNLAQVAPGNGRSDRCTPKGRGLPTRASIEDVSRFWGLRPFAAPYDAAPRQPAHALP